MLIALNKPYGVVCQFSPSGNHPTLAEFVDVPRVYPAGRLDRDSEGLLLLTDEGPLQHRIAGPAHELEKRYWVEVEGTPDADSIQALLAGVELSDGPSRALRARILEAPPIWARVPPVRTRLSIPTGWIEIVLIEGRNRQIRRTTAAVGLPTLRLVRVSVGELHLMTLNLEPGAWCPVKVERLGLPEVTFDRSEARPARRVRVRGMRPPR